MKSKIYIAAVLMALLFSVNQTSYAQAPSWLWAKSVGSTVNDLCHSVAVDDSGNVYATGSYEGTVDFNPGPGVFNMTSQGILDIYILKLDSAGNFVWAKSFGGTGTESGFGIKVDHLGNVFATGRYANTVDFDPGAGTFNLTSNGDKDIFIVKLFPTGDFSWAKSVGGTGDDEGLGIALDNSGNILVTGYFATMVDFDPDAGVVNLSSYGNFDAFVLKLESGGSFVWAKSWGSTLSDVSGSIAVDTANNVYTTGYFINTVDFDPGAALFNITTNGYMDVFISKLDEAGNFIWAKNLGGTQGDNGYSIYADVAGNVFITGEFRGTADFNPGAGIDTLVAAGGLDIFISKLDANGDFGWADGMGEGVGITPDDYSYSIAADNMGNIYTTGSFKSTVDFDPGAGVFNLTSAGSNDCYIQKIDTSGKFVWASKVGSFYSDQGTSIAFDKTNHLYIGGHFMSSTIAFSNDTLTNSVFGGATADIFIAKLDSGINTAGIANNPFESAVKLYPNPAKEFFVIEFPLAAKANADITIADITGKEIYKANITGKQNLMLSTKKFSEGIYLVKIQSENFSAMKKLLVLKY